MKSQRGFTLVELLIVIAIIGVLTSILVTTINSGREKARLAKAQYAADALKKIIQIENFGITTDINLSTVSGVTPNASAVGYDNGTYSIYSIDSGQVNWSSDTPLKSGFSLFLEQAEHLVINNPFSSWSGTEGLSLGVWLKPENSDGEFTYTVLPDVSPGMENNFYVKFSYVHDTGLLSVEHGLISTPGVTSISSYSVPLHTGEWSYVVFNARNGEVEFWVNGQRQDEILDADIEVPEAEYGTDIIAPNVLIDGDQISFYNPTQFSGFFNPAAE